MLESGRPTDLEGIIALTGVPLFTTFLLCWISILRIVPCYISLLLLALNQSIALTGVPLSITFLLCWYSIPSILGIVPCYISVLLLVLNHRIPSLQLVREHDSVSAMSGEALPFPPANITLPALVGCFLFWLDFYLILMIFNPKKSAEWNCRVVTFFHGGFSAFLSFLCSFWIGPWPFSYLGKPCTNLHLAIVLISLGYFLFDLLWCVWSKSEGPVMLTHHVVSISGFVLVLATGEYGAEIVAVLGGSEVTNPILQGRWFLKQMGLYNGRIEVAVDWLFLVGFGVMRIGLGTPLFLCFQLTPNIILPARMGSLAMYVISIVFFIQLVLFICRKYFTINKKGKKL